MLDQSLLNAVDALSGADLAKLKIHISAKLKAITFTIGCTYRISGFDPSKNRLITEQLRNLGYPMPDIDRGLADGEIVDCLADSPADIIALESLRRLRCVIVET